MQHTSQRALFEPNSLANPALEAAVSRLANASMDERGAIFTRREVVEFILDLTGYTADRPLWTLSVLEPSFGGGDFLVPIIERLLHSWRAHHGDQQIVGCDLGACLVAVELHGDTFQATRGLVLRTLESHGLAPEVAEELAARWLVQGDFLLETFASRFDFVVGNPPYIRQELVPEVLMAEYRRHYATIYDRADIYVPFIERSLSLLKAEGRLGFICSDRWMKNRYGGPLRRLVGERYHLEHFVDMTGTSAFHSNVIAYPAVFVIANSMPGGTRVADAPQIALPMLQGLAVDMTGELAVAATTFTEVHGVVSGDSPWMLESFDKLKIVRMLEARWPTLEEAGCHVGIGVATGADAVFVAEFAALDVEDDRKLPLVMTRDIGQGHVSWRGFGVINPFEADGSLATLDTYPRFARYLESHRDLIEKRHVSKRNQKGWYRTIDRIYPELAKRSKLLIPDIKGSAHVVLEEGRLYPHHNLYYVVSDTWDLRALQVVLQSSVTRAFIELYSTRMRGGYLRYQAQYLRRIRLPHWGAVADAVKDELMQAARCREPEQRDSAVSLLYGITARQAAALQASQKAIVEAALA